MSSDDDLPEFVGVHELTAILGVSRQRVDQLARQDGFPEPVARLKVGRVWRSSDVEAWRLRRDTRKQG